MAVQFGVRSVVDNGRQQSIYFPIKLIQFAKLKKGEKLYIFYDEHEKRIILQRSGGYLVKD